MLVQYKGCFFHVYLPWDEWVGVEPTDTEGRLHIHLDKEILT